MRMQNVGGLIPVRIREYLFGSWIDRSGTRMLTSRFDLGLALVLGVALMAAIAYSAEPHHGWTLRRTIIVGAILLMVIVFAQRLRVVFACGFALITFRIAIAAILGFHLLVMLPIALISAAISWALFRGQRQ
jgi:hypothetical protein